MKKYLIFDLDGTLIQSASHVSEIIYNYIETEINPELVDTARYLIKNNGGMSIKEAMDILIENKKESKKHYKKIINLIDSIQDEIVFFDGVQNKIKELSQKYTLLISTGSTDEFANNILKKGNIHHYFDKILGSTYIIKSPEHMEILYDFVGDTDFYEKSVFIGDGERDRFIAQSKKIDFIHVGDNKTDTYEINNVSEIDTILEQF